MSEDLYPKPTKALVLTQFNPSDTDLPDAAIETILGRWSAR